MRKSTAFFILAMFAQSALSGRLESISFCAAKAKEFSNVSLSEFAAEFASSFELTAELKGEDSEWVILSDRVKWDNASCYVRGDIVVSLIINGKTYVYDEFAGKDAYELNQELSDKTEQAKNDLLYRVKMAQQAIELLDRKMRAASAALRKKDWNEEEIRKRILLGIDQALAIPQRPN